MRHVIIVAHPASESFNLSVARAYAQAAKSLGHEAVVRDLYRLPFDPILKEDERDDRRSLPVHVDVATERDILRSADVIALIYPVWFGSPPAILKGYIERIFGQGFAFETLRLGRTRPLLGQKKLISFSTSGSTDAWLGEQGVMGGLRALFDSYLGRVTGMNIADHIHFGAIVPELDARTAAAHLDAVTAAVRGFYG